eukprot:5440582-Alexandrium_andersonii.AAC.1
MLLPSRMVQTYLRTARPPLGSVPSQRRAGFRCRPRSAARSRWPDWSLPSTVRRWHWVLVRPKARCAVGACRP